MTRSVEEGDPRGARPLASKPRYKGLWNYLGAGLLPLAVSLAIGLSALGIGLTLPIEHRLPVSVDLVSEGGIACGLDSDITTPHDGTFDFSWVTNISVPVGLTVGGNPGSFYYQSGVAGSGSLTVYKGTDYIATFCSAAPEQVHLWGTIYFDAPVL